jgi:hypothetical protein
VKSSAELPEDFEVGERLTDRRRIQTGFRVDSQVVYRSGTTDEPPPIEYTDGSRAATGAQT